MLKNLKRGKGVFIMEDCDIERALFFDDKAVLEFREGKKRGISINGTKIFTKNTFYLIDQMVQIYLIKEFEKREAALQDA